jgi:hypothetical protein
MFGRSIFTFVFLMACLVVGTIFFIEKQTGKDIFPRDISFIPRHNISQTYREAKIKAQYWWAKILDKNPVHVTEHSKEKADVPKPEIIKWQDKEGTWHFEYQKASPPAKP